MTSSAGCLMRRLAVLGIVTSSLTACATVGSEGGGGPAVCPPVVDYDREFQARTAGELALLPEGSSVAIMLSDYAMMREQGRVCRRSG